MDFDRRNKQVLSILLVNLTPTSYPFYNNQFLFFVNFDIPLGNPAEPRAGIFPFQYFANMIYFSQNWASSPFMRGRLITN